VLTNENTALNSNYNNDFFYATADSIEYPKKLKIQQVKDDENFKTISDKEANDIIEGLYKLSIITYKIFKNKNQWE